MKIPNHKLHSDEYDNLYPGKEFVFNGKMFLCNRVDEEYVYYDRMIFENDMPFHCTWEQSFYDKKDEKIRLSRKFKPGGITNNIEEWRQKNLQYKNPELGPIAISLMPKNWLK